MTSVGSQSQAGTSARIEQRSTANNNGGGFVVLMMLEGMWPAKVIAISVFMDFLQLLGFVVNPYFKWGPLAGIFPDMVYMSHLPVFEPRYSSLSYLEYSAFLWLLVCFLFVLAAGIVVSISHAADKKRTFVTVMRPISSCLTSWMFIPLLHCVCAMMICTGDAMWLFPDVSCWSSTHLPHIIAGCLVFLIYLPGVYVVRRSVYEASPTRHYFYAKSHSNIDGVDFVFKIALVLLYHILVSEDSTIAFAFFAAGCSLIMACLYAYSMPYFNKTTNCVKVAQMTSLFAASVIYLVTEMGDFSQPDCRGILLLSLLPVVIICGYMCGTVRVNSMFLHALRLGHAHIHQAVWPTGLPTCNIALPSAGEVSHPGDHTSSVMTQSVMQSWDDNVHDGSFTIPYISSVNIETDVELATRCIDTWKKHTSFVEVTYVCHIYAKGLLIFREGSLVKLHYVWFLLCVAERPQQAYAYFERNEDFARVFAFDVSLFSKYNSRKVIEKLRRKLNIRERHHEAYGRKAVALHQEVLKQMHQFWQKLMELSADMHEVGNLASSIAENREKGMMLFKRALTGDVRMLHSFADFLEGVMLNKDAANLCMEEIAELEMEKKARQMGAAKKTVQNADVSIVQRLLDNVTAQKDTFGTAASSTVRRLSVNMNIVFALLMVLIVRNLVSDIQNVSTQIDVVHKMDTAGQARMLTQKVAYEIYDLFYIMETEITSRANGNPAQPEKIEQQRIKVADTAARFTAAHNALTYGKYETSYTPHVRYYEEPINEILIAGNRTVLMSLWEIGNKITNSLHTIDLNLTYDLLNPRTIAQQQDQLTTPLTQAMTYLLRDDSIYFILTNTPLRVSTAFNRSMVFYEDESSYRLNNAIYDLITLFAVSLVIIAAIYFLFLWNFKKITVSKLIILQLFTLIPYDTLARLSADAKERLALKGSAQIKKVKKGADVLPKELLDEIDKGLDGVAVEVCTPLAVLEEYLQEHLEPHVMTKLKQYVKMVKHKTRCDALDGEMLAFVKLNIFNVAVPASCLKKDSTKRPAGTGHKVGFKGKTILGHEETNKVGETSENENDKEKGTKMAVEENLIMTNDAVKRTTEKSKTSTVPVCFWILNLLLVSLLMTCLALLLVSYFDCVGLYTPFRDEVTRIRKTQEHLLRHQQMVTHARYYAQFGDIRYYLTVVDHLNKETLLVLEQDLISSGLTSKEISILQKSKEHDVKIQKALRVSLALSSIAFKKDTAMTAEMVDTYWETPEETLLQKGTHFETIQKYGKYFGASDTNLLDKEKSMSLSSEEQEAAARSLLFGDVFADNYKKYQDVLRDLIKTVSGQRDEAFGKKLREILYLIVVLMYTSVIVCLCIIYTLNVAPALAFYKKLWFWYMIAAASLAVTPIMLLVETAMVVDAEDAMVVSHKFLKDFNSIQAESQRPNELMQSFVQFGVELYGVAYYEEAGNDRFNTYKELFAKYIPNVVATRRLEANWETLEKYQMIAASLTVNSINAIPLLKDFVANVTWDFKAEPDYRYIAYRNPICEDRDVGCRKYAYTNSTNDLRLPSGDKRKLAREILFTNPYTETFGNFKADMERARVVGSNALIDDVKDKTDKVETYSLVFSSIGVGVTACVAIGVSVLIGHILIELAGKQQKQKNNQLDSPLLRVLLIRCRLSLCLIAVLIAIIFGVGLYSVKVTRDQAEDLNLVSAREWLVARSMVYANQFDVGNSEVRGVAMTMMQQIVSELNRIRNRLYFGSPDKSSYNEVQNTNDQNHLTFGGDDIDLHDSILASYYSDACNNPMTEVKAVPAYTDPLSTLDTPLDLAIHAWQGDIRSFMKTVCTQSNCADRDAELNKLRNKVTPLVHTLESSGMLYEDKAVLATNTYSMVSKILFGLTLFTILLLYILVFRKMVSKLTHEENGTKGVLKMIPPAVVESVPAISEYLETGRVDNTEQLAKNFEQSEKLLANILPENISRRLKSGESPIADTHASITILFTDFVGFTSISSNLSAVEIISFLNEVFLEFDTIAELLELEKIKTIGDAYFMAGGLKPSITDHAVRVVEAGLLMFQALDEHNQRHTDRKELRMRLGCHTGPCVAGCIGVKKVAYDLWGESVAMAEKMESGGVPGRVHMSTTTTAEVWFHFICDTCQVEKLYSIEPRGHPNFSSFLIINRKQPSPYMHLVCEYNSTPANFQVRDSSRVPIPPSTV